MTDLSQQPNHVIDYLCAVGVGLDAGIRQGKCLKWHVPRSVGEAWSPTTDNAAAMEVDEAICDIVQKHGGYAGYRQEHDSLPGYEVEVWKYNDGPGIAFCVEHTNRKRARCECFIHIWMWMTRFSISSICRATGRLSLDQMEATEPEPAESPPPPPPLR